MAVIVMLLTVSVEKRRILRIPWAVRVTNNDWLEKIIKSRTLHIPENLKVAGIALTI